MRKMIIYSIILLTAGLFSTRVEAQNNVYVGEIRVTRHRFEQRGDSVFIEMTIDMNGLPVGNNEAFTLTPVIEKGTEVEELPSVIVNGKRRSKAYQRSLYFNRGAKPFPTYSVVAANKRTREKVNYKISVPYQAWMQDAALNLHESFYDGIDQRLISVNLLAKALKPDAALKGKVQIVAPTPLAPEPVTRTTPVVKENTASPARAVEGSAYLDYPRNRTNIIPDYKDNREELAKIKAMIDEITSNPDHEITGIYLTGYASPEGTYARNEQLSRERTLELRDYLLDRYPMPRNLYHADWVAEDWTGLKKLITQFGMPDKDRVLYIINNVDIFEGREKKLMDLDQGVPYRYMLKEFFPRLRRVDYKITYRVIK
ncbi:DUF3868 domain-containing protein [Butyricimonas hominis]